LRHRADEGGGETVAANVVDVTPCVRTASTSVVGAASTEDIGPVVAFVALALVVAWLLPAEPEQPAIIRHAPMTRHGLFRVINVSVVEVEET
jgi:hypothetical protein